MRKLRFFGVPILLISLLIFLILFYFNDSLESNLCYKATLSLGCNLSEIVALSALQWQEIEQKVYQQYGLTVEKLTYPILKLHRLKPLVCSEIFGKWLSVSSAQPLWNVPPVEIPTSLREQFLMNGLAILEQWYFDNMESPALTWNKMQIDRIINSSDYITPYVGEGDAVYAAIEKYSVWNQTGLIIGSESPWVESACIRNKARKVVTVDYRIITCDHPICNFVHALTLARNWEKFAGTFDFAISFSSIEHSGLGRYGDLLDPIGDLREMQKLQCLLKKNGLLYLGVPVGVDMITFNAHRIYGKVRLPMLLEGYEILDVYYGRKSISMNAIQLDKLNIKGGQQLLFVLRKVAF